MSRSARRMDARATPREFKPECAVDTPSYKQKQREISSGAPKELVRSSGFEPPRYCYRQPLKLVRLPVPPRPHRSENFIVNAPPQSGKAPMECAECGSPSPAFTEEASAPRRDYSGHPELTASQASTEQAAVASTIAVVPQAALESPES